jgi:putative addiction module component (TIGR02574 family)
VTSAELKRHALALPRQQRIELIDALLEEGLPPLTEAQKVLIDQRWTAYEANPDDVFPAEAVHPEAIARGG